jgi:DNA-3-methyladenine glycosylase II
MKELSFSLKPLPPFRLDLTAWALRRRSINTIDSWDGETYSRVLVFHDQPVFIQVTQSGAPISARLQVKTLSQHHSGGIKVLVTHALEKMLGLQVNMGAFYQFAKTDSHLDVLSQRFLGLKPPRFPSVFEGIVNGIACQQLSLHVGLLFLNRLTAKAGLPFDTSNTTRFSFPSAESMAHLSITSFRPLGFSTNKGIALKQLALDVSNGAFNPEILVNLDNEHAKTRLQELRGIGRWTAEYVLLRGLGRTDLFPGDDIGARNNLQRWLKLRGKLDYADVNSTLAKWRPFAGLLYFHLLLDSLENSGDLRSEGRIASAA